MKWLKNLSLDKENHVYEGIVRTGRGGGVKEMSEPTFLESLRDLVGLDVIPGTLNIGLSEPIELPLFRYVKFKDMGWDFDPATQGIDYHGEIGVYYRRVTVAKKYPAYAIIFTWVRDLRTDIELISPHHLRTVLNLKDGDKIKFSLDRVPAAKF
jgi:CTP-dependent riboflavin kinase